MTAFVRSSSKRKKRQLNRQQHTCVDPQSASLYYDEWPPDPPPSDEDDLTKPIVLGRSRPIHSKRKQSCVQCAHSSSSSSTLIDRWRNVLQHTMNNMATDDLDLHNYQFIPGQMTTDHPAHRLFTARPQSTPTPTHSSSSLFGITSSTTTTPITDASLNTDQHLQIGLGINDTMDSLSPPTKKRRTIKVIPPPPPPPRHRMTLRSTANK